MFDAQPPDPELLSTLLKPLLEDFQYWFERSHTLLEDQLIDFLGAESQAILLEQVKQAQREVRASLLLLEATDGQVGVEMGVLMGWHQLVSECWQVAIRYRLESSPQQKWSN